MKEKIHPKFGPATIKCACGNTIKTASTISEMHVEICSACHPTFTGKQKFVDTAGMLDKFKARQEKFLKLKQAKKDKKPRIKKEKTANK